MSANHSLLQLRGASKVFSRGTMDEVRALDNANLDVSAEDFITVIGSNGAGKPRCSMLLPVSIPRKEGARLLLTAKMLPISVNTSALNISAGSIRTPTQALPLK